MKSFCEKPAVLGGCRLKACLLPPGSDLREINLVRVKALESSMNKIIINSDLFPDGSQDDLNTSAQHPVITDDLNKIIASKKEVIFVKVQAPHRNLD